MLTSVGSVVDKIQAYNKLLEEFEFVKLDCGGRKPWSHRATNGSIFVDTRNSEWTAYRCATEIELATGPDPETLEQYLSGTYKHGGGI